MSTKIRVTVLVVLFAAACFRQTFDIKIRNSTGATIRNAHVTFDSFESIGGVLGPGVEKTHGGIPGPVPAQVRITWKTTDGYDHVVLARIIVDPHYSGEITFDIQHGGGVKVTTRP